jgi:hypothetical protein
MPRFNNDDSLCLPHYRMIHLRNSILDLDHSAASITMNVEEILAQIASSGKRVLASFLGKMDSGRACFSTEESSEISKELSHFQERLEVTLDRQTSAWFLDLIAKGNGLQWD